MKTLKGTISFGVTAIKVIWEAERGNVWMSNSLDVNSMEIISSKASIAFWALPLPCIVPCFNAIETEHVETLCENCIFVVNITARAPEFCLKAHIHLVTPLVKMLRKIGSNSTVYLLHFNPNSYESSNYCEASHVPKAAAIRLNVPVIANWDLI